VTSIPVVDRVRSLVDPARIAAAPMQLEEGAFGGGSLERREPDLLLFVGRLIERRVRNSPSRARTAESEMVYGVVSGYV